MAEKDDSKPFDRVADLADGYESLARLAVLENGAHCPVVVLLENLNLQLRALVDWADSKGWVS